MLHIKETIIVEGKYDKIKLSSIFDAAIIPTDGFSIFKDREKLDMIRALADKTGLLLLTDSDVAGFKIRNYIQSAVGKEKIKHAYIPEILGKERRKEKPSKEGTLGVEGVPKEVLIQALERAGVLCEQNDLSARREIGKLDFYEDGLSGQAQSAQNRQRVIASLGLPHYLSANALLTVLNGMMRYEEYREMIETLFPGRE